MGTGRDSGGVASDLPETRSKRQKVKNEIAERIPHLSGGASCRTGRERDGSEKASMVS